MGAAHTKALLDSTLGARLDLGENNAIDMGLVTNLGLTPAQLLKLSMKDFSFSLSFMPSIQALY